MSVLLNGPFFDGVSNREPAQRSDGKEQTLTNLNGNQILTLDYNSADSSITTLNIENKKLFKTEKDIFLLRAKAFKKVLY